MPERLLRAGFYLAPSNDDAATPRGSTKLVERLLASLPFTKRSPEPIGVLAALQRAVQQPPFTILCDGQYAI
eukprot:4652539-Prymnesium_polylepis.1